MTTSSWTSPRYEDYYTRQFAEPYRSTLAFRDFVRGILGTSDVTGRRGLDVGCGAGAVLCHVSEYLPGMRWVGLDIAYRHLPKGKLELGRRGIAASLLQGDFYRLDAMFPPKVFDYAFIVQTLSWCPSYEALMEQVLAVTKRCIFISSLFTDFAVEVRSQVVDYSSDPTGAGPLHYNVYNYRRFNEFCRARGATSVHSTDFHIDIDLPPSAAPHPGIGTYTRTLRDGQRLQFSGPMFLPWKFVAVKLD